MNVKKSNLPFRVLFVLKEGKRETREGEKKGNKLAGEKLPKFENANQIPDTTKSHPSMLYLESKRTNSRQNSKI